MSGAPVKVGLIGCGNISEIYLKNDARFDPYQIGACADLLPERAHLRAEAYGVTAMTVEDLLADPAIDVVLNLTVPMAHAAVAEAAMASGKSVYNEKPLAVDLLDAQRLVDTAAAQGVRLGCAPDTFLGAGLQTCRHAIDDGLIGEPVAATAFFMGSGPERWHPNPEFFYLYGGGPMLDMAPYYLTALVSLLGPVSRVTGSARAAFAERVLGSKGREGERIPVETPTHFASVLDFAAGPIATLVTSFDVQASETPRIEIYGSEATLSVPDPNTFGGPVRLRRAGQDTWQDLPITLPWDTNSRGVGLADLCAGLRSGQPHRASGELAYHVLEIMHAVSTASDTGAHVALQTAPARPAPLTEPLGTG
ncbi:MAG: Gfo/Idh/MocA family oxidoreductase [Thermomicrobiales bacterium]|nr:Gfo/Idh/MocA family oxidoreductase [Thermomicrobiales bacterium]